MWAGGGGWRAVAGGGTRENNVVEEARMWENAAEAGSHWGSLSLEQAEEQAEAEAAAAARCGGCWAGGAGGPPREGARGRLRHKLLAKGVR